MKEYFAALGQNKEQVLNEAESWGKIKTIE